MVGYIHCYIVITENAIRRITIQSDIVRYTDRRKIVK